MNGSDCGLPGHPISVAQSNNRAQLAYAKSYITQLVQPESKRSSNITLFTVCARPAAEPNLAGGHGHDRRQHWTTVGHLALQSEAA